MVLLHNQLKQDGNSDRRPRHTSSIYSTCASPGNRVGTDVPGQEPPHPSKKCTKNNEMVPLTHTHAPEHTHPEGCEGTAAKTSQTVGVASAWMQAAV